MSEVQQTLVLIKPDGVRRNLIGEIISRLEAKGYVVADLKKLTPSRDLLAMHYAGDASNDIQIGYTQIIDALDTLSEKV